MSQRAGHEERLHEIFVEWPDRQALAQAFRAEGAGTLRVERARLVLLTAFGEVGETVAVQMRYGDSGDALRLLAVVRTVDEDGADYELCEEEGEERERFLGHLLSTAIGHPRPRSFRVPSRLPVRFDREDGEGELDNGLALNLSESGIFISTSRPLPAGARTRIRLGRRAFHRGLELDGRVVWSVSASERPGMGLAFENLSEKQRGGLHALVARLLAGDRGLWDADGEAELRGAIEAGGQSQSDRPGRSSEAGRSGPVPRSRE